MLAAAAAVAAIALGGGALGGDLLGGDPLGGDPARQRAPQQQERVQDGLPTVPASELPLQAREVLSLIDEGGPFPYEQDGSTFSNREGLLPQEERGCYREYTVETPGERDRGARRIVTSCRGPEYWTADHYESFARITGATL